MVEFFRQYYGRINRAFSSLKEDSATSLGDQLEASWAADNRGRDELTVVAAEYLEVEAICA